MKIRDHSFEQQRYRASGLNLVTTAMLSLSLPLPPAATGVTGCYRLSVL